MEPFLEQAADEAVGSNYGPAGGKFASKDIRVSTSLKCLYVKRPAVILRYVV